MCLLMSVYCCERSPYSVAFGFKPHTKSCSLHCIAGSYAFSFPPTTPILKTHSFSWDGSRDLRTAGACSSCTRVTVVLVFCFGTCSILALLSFRAISRVNPNGLPSSERLELASFHENPQDFLFLPWSRSVQLCTCVSSWW